jgi:hypothetical protein
VVALHHRYEADEEPADLASARAEVEWRSAGLSRALLATPPDVLRTIAERARQAEVTLARWEARVGEKPILDPAADAEVLAAVEEVQAARAGQNHALQERHRLLATGNGCGLLGLGVAAVQVLTMGSSPMALPVAAAVAVAPIGPVVGAWIAAQRCSLAARRLLVARGRWTAALEAAGVGTMGELAARRIAVAAWERCSAEADAVVEAARPHQRAWYRLAGPGVAPTEVEDVLDRIEALRQAQLRLLGLLLSEVVERQAMDVLAPPEEDGSAPSWLDGALDRIRSGGRLRLWGS